MNEITRSEDFPNVLCEVTMNNLRKVHIVPLTFGRARIALVSATDPLCYDDLW